MSDYDAWMAASEAPMVTCGVCGDDIIWHRTRKQWEHIGTYDHEADGPAPVGSRKAQAAAAQPIVAFQYNATVLRVIDGDTIEVDVDHGFYLHNSPVPVRLLGCNAAEHGTPGGDAAKANLEALLPVGTAIALTTAKPDKFAPRWDAAVTYRGTDGRYRDLVADLIAGQWAAPWNGNGTKPLPPWPRTVA